MDNQDKLQETVYLIQLNKNQAQDLLVYQQEEVVVLQQIQITTYGVVGWSNWGQLGNSGSGAAEQGWWKRKETPTFVKVATGRSNSIAIDSDGNPWVTGADASNGTGEDHAAEGGAIYKWVPLTLKNNYTVIFKNGSTTVKTQEVEEGQSATAPIITKAGYTLSWDKSFSNVTSDLTVNAVWTANTNTRYVVQHYIQNTSLNGYKIGRAHV